MVQSMMRLLVKKVIDECGSVIVRFESDFTPVVVLENSTVVIHLYLSALSQKATELHQIQIRIYVQSQIHS